MIKENGLKNNMKIRDLQTGRFIQTANQIKCDNCGKNILIPEWRIKRDKNHFCSQSCNNKFRVGKLGRNYINGSSFIDYPIEFNSKLKDKIKERDDNMCVLCGLDRKNHKGKYHRDLIIHHIDYNKKNCKENNLISLCLKHNSKVNKISARKNWIKCFKTIIECQEMIGGIK